MHSGRLVIAKEQEFAIREYDVPDPHPTALVIKQELAGICGTDLHNWQNGFDRDTVLGHENVGTIVGMGRDVTTDYLGNKVQEGDRIIFRPGTDGNEGAYGFYYEPDQPPHFVGGFADYIYLGKRGTQFIKTSLPPEVAVLTEPFTVGVHAVIRGQIEFGDTVVVQGSGAIGLVTTICAKVSGAGKIIVVGGPAARLELARKYGADVVIDIEKVTAAEERTELVLAETTQGRGADRVFECAGFLPATPEGLGYLRKGGIFVEVGHFVDMGTLEFNINQSLMVRNCRLEAIWGSGNEHFVRAMPILEKLEFPYAEMVSHILPLEQVQAGFQALNGDYRLNGDTVIKIALGADL